MWSSDNSAETIPALELKGAVGLRGKEEVDHKETFVERAKAAEFLNFSAQSQHSVTRQTVSVHSQLFITSQRHRAC